ncbi:hypothetical protein BH09BAC1_BH09BAC1_00120 [soil metagenome]
MKAIWNNQIIAESEDTIVVERNHYFPADTVNRCPWKGTAAYYDLEVEGKTNAGAA